ncbi:MAG TPA: NAD(P)-dependent oxidoreductase [Casimicrobiaceae bacterium]|jgi:3-hydroxyisobutyrate dehydrogenase-like beta-hydroxyacid dehydrogenase|nr:NAD(P)-dependent oxidoreductase [Casimicrobiaceae bacterium]
MRKSERVGVVGLGIMGSAMAANLVKAKFAVLGYDLLPQRRAELKRAGGEVARSTQDLGGRATIVITSLPSAHALRDVASGLAAEGRRGQIVVETSTLSISDKERARALLARRGISLLDCPLSGTGAQARTKDLVVYASGTRSAYRRCIHVLEGFARAHYFIGPFGAGSKMKFVANLLVAIHNVSTAEALVLGRKAGLDANTMVKVLADGAGSSRMLQVRGPMMVKRNYSPAAMKVGIWQKDMQIIGEFARELGSPTPLFDATASIYDAAIAAGFAEQDTAAVCAVLERVKRHRRI